VLSSWWNGLVVEAEVGESVPAGLAALVERHSGEQRPAPYRTATWHRHLAQVPGDVTRFLSDDRFSSPVQRGRGDRCTSRRQLLAACSTVSLDDRSDVLAALVLVMAWGSGTRAGARGAGNTKRALADAGRAHDVLRGSAETLRRSKDIRDGGLRVAHGGFMLPGIRESFFTKWFAFAGHTAGRPWQPLILDARVRSTLRVRLECPVQSLTGERGPAARYEGYVDAAHAWGSELGLSGERVEWVLFEDAGSSRSG
jgi:hypothetical protein